MDSLTTLKEEAKKEFLREYRTAYQGIIPESVLAVGNTWFTDFVEKAIDRTYHATKEEDKKLIESMKVLEVATDSHNLMHKQRFNRSLEKVLAALEDTTTSPTN